jgi:hypothetical protein
VFCPAVVRAGFPEDASLSFKDGQKIVAGSSNEEAVKKYFNCAENKAQSTIKSCTLKEETRGSVKSLDLDVHSAMINIHYKGDVINMFVDFVSASFDSVREKCLSKFGPQTKVEYWSDPSHLYGSYNWIDAKVMVEAGITKTIKGEALPNAKNGVYFSSMAGNRRLHENDRVGGWKEP